MMADDKHDSSGWMRVGDAEVHQGFFRLGFFVVKPATHELVDEVDGPYTFQASSSRRLQFKLPNPLQTISDNAWSDLKTCTTLRRQFSLAQTEIKLLEKLEEIIKLLKQPRDKVKEQTLLSQISGILENYQEGQLEQHKLPKNDIALKAHKKTLNTLLRDIHDHTDSPLEKHNEKLNIILLKLAKKYLTYIEELIALNATVFNTRFSPLELTAYGAVTAAKTLFAPLEDVSTKAHGDKACHYLPGVPALFNTTRAAEAFIPFFLDDDVAIYLYPWQTKGTKVQGQAPVWTGNKTCVTALCLLGSGLIGMDKLGGERPLIKHNLEFYPKQVINRIIFDPKKFNLYEYSTLQKMRHLSLFINKTSSSDETKTIFVHLPHYDYILFGLELFSHGRITMKALKRFFCIVLQQAK